MLRKKKRFSVIVYKDLLLCSLGCTLLLGIVFCLVPGPLELLYNQTLDLLPFGLLTGGQGSSLSKLFFAMYNLRVYLRTRSCKNKRNQLQLYVNKKENKHYCYEKYFLYGMIFCF